MACMEKKSTPASKRARPGVLSRTGEGNSLRFHLQQRHSNLSLRLITGNTSILDEAPGKFGHEDRFLAQETFNDLIDREFGTTLMKLDCHCRHTIEGILSHRIHGVDTLKQRVDTIADGRNCILLSYVFGKPVHTAAQSLI